MGRLDSRNLFLSICVAALPLAGCMDVTGNGTETPGDTTETAAAPTPSRPQSSRRNSKDIEAPEVFGVTDKGLWDGRPSLGGIWIAYPDVKMPERVLIQNTQNGKSIVGALFTRERENPGPKFQVSADAASGLGMLAGAPATLKVTALREQKPEPEAAAKAEVEDIPAETPAKPAAAAPATEAAGDAKDEKAESSLRKPLILIGNVPTMANAESVASKLNGAGLAPHIQEVRKGEDTSFRLTVGPAGSRSELAEQLEKVKALGYPGALAVAK